MSIQYVICAAGEGRRFNDLYPGLPKPLITLNGQTLLEWSLRSLPLVSEDIVIIIVQKHHRIKSELELRLQNHYPFNSFIWIEIDHLSRGQLETALFAKPYLAPTLGLGIFNSDTYFQSKTLHHALSDSTIDGIIPCATLPGSDWSFCKTRSPQSSQVVQVTEKQRISDWASVGFYFFRQTHTFLLAAEKRLSIDQNGEYYIAPLYNDLISKKQNIVIDPVLLFKPMGSPDQLKTYWQDIPAAPPVHPQSKTLVIDLDNTITVEEKGTPYAHKKPHLPIIQKLHHYKKRGYSIIIYTARRMQTHNGNEAKLLADIGETTFRWLNEHNVPYDGIKIGKPFAENGFYVDDKSIRPDEFLSLSEQEILELIQ